MSNFITPVTMKVTLEQYEQDLEGPLKEMGYEWGTNNTPKKDFEGGYPYLFNFYVAEGFLGGLEYQRDYTIETYNPQLFLALAAQTNDERGIDEEYFINTLTKEICQKKNL